MYEYCYLDMLLLFCIQLMGDYSMHKTAWISYCRTRIAPIFICWIYKSHLLISNYRCSIYWQPFTLPKSMVTFSLEENGVTRVVGPNTPEIMIAVNAPPNNLRKFCHLITNTSPSRCLYDDMLIWKRIWFEHQNIMKRACLILVT